MADGTNSGTWSGGLSDILTTLRNGVVAIGNLNKTLSMGFLNQTGTSTNAAAGTAGAPPAQVAGYFTVPGPNGTTVRVPFYN